MTTSKPIRLLGLSGSLRKKSYNAALLRAAAEIAPESVALEIFDLSEIPLYNEDVREKGFPAPVQALREKIAGADGVLIATPEYNYSIPGVLKNAIDWASRPPDQPFNGKPVGIIGASPGRFGTARAQYHLRQCFVFLNASVLNKPEVMVGGAADAFDDDLRLTDESTRRFISQMLDALTAAIERAG